MRPCSFQDWKIPFYSWIIYITGKVVDTIIAGASYEKACLIISEKLMKLKKNTI